MSSYELNLRIDNSIPSYKISTFPRFREWKDADATTITASDITMQLVTSEEIMMLSSRWNAEYTYGLTTETDPDGEPIFTDMPHGSVDAEQGLLTCSLQKGANYILVERFGGILRDYKVGEVVPGTSIWSKAKVSGYLIVTVE